MQYCSIVDVVPHLCPLTGEGNHIFVVKKMLPPPKSEHLPTPMNNHYFLILAEGLDFIALPTNQRGSESFLSEDNQYSCTNYEILDDSEIEGDEYFTVTLSSNDPMVIILVTSEATVTIVDDDTSSTGTTIRTTVSTPTTRSPPASTVSTPSPPTNTVPTAGTYFIVLERAGYSYS